MKRHPERHWRNVPREELDGHLTKKERQAKDDAKRQRKARKQK